MGKKWQLRVWKCRHYFSANLPVTSHKIFVSLSLSLSLLRVSLLRVSLVSLSSCIFIFFVVEWKVHIDGMALTVILLFFVDTYYIYQTHPFNHTNKNNNNESFPIPISDPDKYSLPRIIITYQPSYSNRGSNLSFILIMKHGSLLSLVQYLYSICTR